MFDKMSPETYKLVEEKAGKPAANVLFVVFLLAAVCGGTALVIVSVKTIALNAVMPALTAITSRFSPSQVGNVISSVALTVTALLLLFMQISRAMSKVGRGIVSSVDSRIGELAGVVGSLRDRVEYLEVHAASAASVNKVLKTVDESIPLPPPMQQMSQAELDKWAIIRLLNSPTVKPVGHRLTIVSATYGVPGGKSIDVRDVLTAQIDDNRIDLHVSNKTMGKDPQYGSHKFLHVVYSVGTVTREVTVSEDSDLKIPE